MGAAKVAKVAKVAMVVVGGGGGGGGGGEEEARRSCWQSLLVGIERPTSLTNSTHAF